MAIAVVATTAGVVATDGGVGAATTRGVVATDGGGTNDAAGAAPEGAGDEDEDGAAAATAVALDGSFFGPATSPTATKNTSADTIAVQTLCRTTQLRLGNKFQPSGGGPQAGSGCHPAGGVHPAGVGGQFGGGVKRCATRFPSSMAARA
jgi:hypothetical protein